MMTTISTRHEFIPQLVLFGEGVSAHCACGWRSQYTHAFEKYAKEDYDHHIQVESDTNVHSQV